MVNRPVAHRVPEHRLRTTLFSAEETPSSVTATAMHSTKSTELSKSVS